MLFMVEKPIFLLILLLIPILWMTLYRSISGRPIHRSWVLAGIMRSLLIIVLSLALSDARILTDSDRVNIFFCMDISESIDPEMMIKAVDFIRNTVRGMKEEDQAGLILFGKESSIELSLSEKYEHPVYRSIVNKNFTNIYSALELAIGKLPRTGKNRIVLLTDGNENMGQAMEMAYIAASLGIEIFPVPLSSQMRQREVRIETLETPLHVNLDTPFEVRLVITSKEKAAGELAVQRNDEIVMNQNVSLEPGKNQIRFSDTLEKHGLYRYKAIIHTADDTYFQNNQGISFTYTHKRPTILYVSPHSQTQQPPVLALQSQGFDIINTGPEAIPTSIHGLADYNAIILDNVQADSMPFGAMETVEQYVRDMGGGLIMIGGDKSFGAGHYIQTPIEKALPVYMDIPTDTELAGICIILIIDKSHSMVGSSGSKNKLEMAKIAAFSTVELLNPIDSVGLLAFDTAFQWVVPVTRVKDRQQIAQKLSTLKAEGGTDLYPSLKVAFRVLKDYEAAKKHIIVLSDGQTNEADFKSLIESIRSEDITMSTVAVGTNADLILMSNIAHWGGGRAYYTDDPDHIPRIFTDETKIVAKALLIEKEMRPTIVTQSEFLQGIPLNNLPIIKGHVLSYPKPGSNIVFQTLEGPLLVTGQYGLGRSVAYTSDLSGRWGKEWVEWEHFGQFLSQMVKWVQKKETQQRFTPTIKSERGSGIFLVDVMDEQNRFINNLSLNVRVLYPDDRSKEISLDQIAPGRYRAHFQAEEVGEYYLNLTEKSETGPVSSQVFGFGIPYAEEFVDTDINSDLLNKLGKVTGGKSLQPDQTYEELFSSDSKTKEYGIHLWPYLLTFFILLLIADVAMRKFRGNWGRS